MGKLTRFLGAVFGCFCIATVLAGVLAVALGWQTGRLDRAKVARLAAVIQGLEPRGIDVRHAVADGALSAAEGEDRDAKRFVQFRLLELREQSLENRLQQVRFERGKLDDEKKRFELDKLGFERRLGAEKLNAIAAGNENARLLLESVRPKQSKELIMMMLKAEEIEAVVTLFSAMPIAKRAKIAAEFKTEEETTKLDEILRRIREGQPDVGLIDETINRLSPSGPTQ